MGPQSMAFFHRAALKMLGLLAETTPFESRMARDPQMTLFSRRRGLRVPAIATGFDALCWAIIGQQIHMKFACALRREIIARAGEDAGGNMRAHPTAARVADIGVAALTRNRYSRSKAAYLIGAAEKVAQGHLDVEAMAAGSAFAAEKALTAVRGVGIWTARYVLLRSGFADCAPVGDSALATALQRLYRRPDRPNHGQVHTMMAMFAPHRTLATGHLWASLRDAA
jgi:AraC family transcriptional regulator of adaptative response / DNA-3-methyladenine glycosylase II